MFSPRWQDDRSLLLERLGRTPTVGEVFEFLRESSQAGRSTHGDSLENHEVDARADYPSRSQPGSVNQRLCWSLKEAAEGCGVSYHTLYRAACRGDLKIIKGFGQMMVSESELPRFVANVTEYLPRKRKR
jgi:helix-turn-helix protein